MPIEEGNAGELGMAVHDTAEILAEDKMTHLAKTGMQLEEDDVEVSLADLVARRRRMVAIAEARALKVVTSEF